MELERDDRIPQHVLVIAAHPDDIEFGCAGSIARWVGAGAQVTYCIVTDGAAGSNDPRVAAPTLARQRYDEQRAAAAAVGVHDVRFLNYRDGQLQATLDLRRDLTRLIREVRPDRVICQDPTTVFVNGSYINHPDHRATGEAAIYAVFPSAPTRLIFPELLAEGLEPHQVRELYLDLTLEPTRYVDISETIERKIEALLCHRSQVDAEAARWVREWAADIGKRVGCAYAEAFRVIRLVEEEGGGKPS